MSEPDDDTLLDLNPGCPACGKHGGVGEVLDGGMHNCVHCGRLLIAIAYADGTMMMLLAQDDRILPDLRTGRQITRSRWKRQGRR